MHRRGAFLAIIFCLFGCHDELQLSSDQEIKMMNLVRFEGEFENTVSINVTLNCTTNRISFNAGGGCPQYIALNDEQIEEIQNRVFDISYLESEVIDESSLSGEPGIVSDYATFNTGCISEDQPFTIVNKPGSNKDHFNPEFQDGLVRHFSGSAHEGLYNYLRSLVDLEGCGDDWAKLFEL